MMDVKIFFSSFQRGFMSMLVCVFLFFMPSIFGKFLDEILPFPVVTDAVAYNLEKSNDGYVTFDLSAKKQRACIFQSVNAFGVIENGYRTTLLLSFPNQTINNKNLLIGNNYYDMFKVFIQNSPYKIEKIQIVSSHLCGMGFPLNWTREQTFLEIDLNQLDK